MTTRGVESKMDKSRAFGAYGRMKPFTSAKFAGALLAFASILVPGELRVNRV